MVGLPH